MNLSHYIFIYSNMIYCLVDCYINFIILVFICEPIYMKIILINVFVGF